MNTKLAAKVLEIVDAGLVYGLGDPEPGKMCVEAAVCYAMGLPHGDQPNCVAPSLRGFKIRLNDAAWSSPAARAKGLRRLAVAQLGSAGALDETAFAYGVAVLAQKWAATGRSASHRWVALRAAAAAKCAAHAKYAAEAAAEAAQYAAADDTVLAACAEDVVQLLIELKAPGCRFLYLTE